MLTQAVEDIRQGQFAKARDILTKLLRTDQNNATYWVWMSAAMETPKERLYCLQMANKTDPLNASARRGLILMGALTPDDTVQPFPMNHPRPWEAKVKLADEKPDVTGLKRFTSSPVFRLSAILGFILILIVAAVFGVGTLLNGPAAQQIVLGGTARPSVTPYATSINVQPQATVSSLSDLLTSGTLTPTLVYALTPHSGVSLDTYRGAQRAYEKGQWDTVFTMMEQVATNEPGSVDTVYFMAEARRLGGQYQDALDYYQKAINVNANFAPIYLGRARANLALNSKKDILPDLDKAITLDSLYTEAYLERSLYFVRKNDLKSARTDLERAASINPTSPTIQINLARVLLKMDENQAALIAAQKANELDLSSLETYLVMGMAYRATGQINRAVKELEIYTQYQPDNAEAFMVLGAAYYNRQDYETALKNLEQAIRLDNKSSESYYWQGHTYLATSKNDLALESFRKSVSYNANSFESGLGVAQAYNAKGEYGNVYATLLKIEKLADTDKKKAILYYNRALSLEKINQMDPAYNDWRLLLKLPADAIPDEMRKEAEFHLVTLRTSTPQPPTATASLAPRGTATRFPTATFTRPPATRTPKVTSTP